MAKSKKALVSLADAAKELLRLAQEGGVEQNYFFTTTYERYETQQMILKALEIALKQDLEPDEYRRVALAYNKSATSANQTAQTCIRIIKDFRNGGMMGGSSDDDGDECDL